MCTIYAGPFHCMLCICMRWTFSPGHCGYICMQYALDVMDVPVYAGPFHWAFLLDVVDMHARCMRWTLWICVRAISPGRYGCAHVHWTFLLDIFAGHCGYVCTPHVLDVVNMYI